MDNHSEKYCDPRTQFKCQSGSIPCVSRSFVNDGKSDCEDKSDELVVDFVCFDTEFSCPVKNITSNETYFRCEQSAVEASVDSSCSRTILIRDCSHETLFLCLDQSRCLPRLFLCDGVQNCIGGSDEI